VTRHNTQPFFPKIRLARQTLYETTKHEKDLVNINITPVVHMKLQRLLAVEESSWHFVCSHMTGMVHPMMEGLTRTTPCDVRCAIPEL